MYMENLLSDKEQIDCWCELQLIPLRNKKIQKPFKQFPKGTPITDCFKWVLDHGPCNAMRLDYEFLIRPEPSKSKEQDHPYLKYRGMGFNTEEFIKMTRKYPTEFVRYCEIVVTENGIIYLAAPSHAYVEERLIKKGYENICSIWYRRVICHELTPMQKKVIENLKEEGLLAKELLIVNVE